MANEDYPTLNGIAPSWADLSAKVQLYEGPELELPDISDLSWGSPVEIGVQRGTGGQIRRRTTGSSTPEASMTLYRSGFRDLVKQMIPIAKALGYVRGNLVRVGLVHFDIISQHTPVGEVEIYTTRILGCRLTDRALSLTEGNDPDKVTAPLSIIKVVDVIDGEEVVLV